MLLSSLSPTHILAFIWGIKASHVFKTTKHQQRPEVALLKTVKGGSFCYYVFTNSKFLSIFL